MNYYIYHIEVGKAHYIGSTSNYKRRMRQHLKDLKTNKHVNDYLQKEYNRTHKFKSSILQKSFTLFRDEILRDEQRWINKLSNSNEGVASKITKYTRKEFYQDMLDTIVKNWKLISALIFVLLTVGYGLSTEQANQILEFVVKMYHQFGG